MRIVIDLQGAQTESRFRGVVVIVLLSPERLLEITIDMRFSSRYLPCWMSRLLMLRRNLLISCQQTILSSGMPQACTCDGPR
jgi:hypothetical protein